MFLSLQLFLLALISLSANGEIGSADGNKQMSPTTANFRSQKLKNIWTKLEKKIPSGEKSALINELFYIDKQLMAEKHSGGSYMADQLEFSLRGILRRYNLENLLPPGDSGNDRLRHFDDFRLDRMWNELLATGAPKEILKEFRQDFKAIQDRINDYERLLKQQTTDENDFNSLDQKRPDQDLSSLKQTRLKIDQDLMALKHKISFRTADRVSPDEKFASLKSNQLWAAALQNLMTADDLEIIRDDLKLLDQKTDKLQYYKSELSSFKANAKYEDRKDTERKVKDLERQVEKLEKYVRSKISSHHSEL